MKIYKHKNYQDYRKAQVATYQRKRDLVWVTNQELAACTQLIYKHTDGLVFTGICHGVRTGYEVDYFQNEFDETAYIEGTEIAESRSDRIIQMDFHDIPDEWENKYDFIYSNSFDHSHMPKKCLNRWMFSLNPTGVCLIHWMQTNVKVNNASDCFSASLNEYRHLIKKKCGFQLVEEASVVKGRVILAIKK